jgi:hypothetical protein
MAAELGEPRANSVGLVPRALFLRKRERKQELAVHVNRVRFEGTSAPRGMGGVTAHERALARGRVAREHVYVWFHHSPDGAA